MKKVAFDLPGYGGINEGATGLGSDIAGQTPAVIINKLVPYVFVIAGLILLGLIISGGFELMTSAGNPETMKKGQGKIASGIVGFLIIFLAYWIAQALGIMLGFNLLSG
ncbi:hypothetical protein KKD62_03610 [Patescibacteria group bacterium]|nr:hypothetical protein [Patescibacteria group bacterium]MBU1931787.1 hypothetical protein [Patescibacteria group bacterium]